MGNGRTREKGFSYVIRNMTKKRQSVIMSNTARTITYFLATPPMRFDKGDTYEIWKVVTTLGPARPGQK